MSYAEEDYLHLSGLQHFAICPRQWALIHIENQWAENIQTIDGQIMHERAHNGALRERRGEILIVRGMNIHSRTLGVTGQCDVVEFHADSTGIPLKDVAGTWIPYPVEYKRGSPKENNADRLQLCGQAMCLEEMFCCAIHEGALYYGEIRRREIVQFSEELRQHVNDALTEMHRLYSKGHTPRCRVTNICHACSLKELCLPKLVKIRSVKTYLDNALEDK